jgi:hypothetical protein
MMKPLPTDDSESESEEPQMVAIMATRSRADVPNGSTVPEPSGANVGEKEKEG